MTIVIVGLNLANNVFAVHGVDEAGKPALVRPNMRFVPVKTVDQQDNLMSLLKVLGALIRAFQ
ncbi:MAG: hypothetical protein RL297_1364 [Pseudomonadota bacterium]